MNGPEGDRRIGQLFALNVMIVFSQIPWWVLTMGVGCHPL